MKQKIDGKKLTNWHKPLKRSRLNQRYRQRRYDDPSLEKVGGQLVQHDDDGYWDPYDPYGCDYYDRADPEELSEFQLTSFLERLLFAPPLYSFDGVAPKSDPPEDSAPLPHPSGQSLEERLAEHIQMSRSISASAAPLRAKLDEALQSGRDLQIIKREGERRRDRSFASNLLLFSPFWIRSPRSWDPATTTLVEHLFVVYPVPAFLHQEWSRFDFRFKWIAWFLLFAQGGSLKRAADIFRWSIPAKLPQHLYKAPASLSPLVACIFAEVHRLGGAEVDFTRLTRDQSFLIDPTELSERASYSPFWQETVRWIITHRDELSDEQCRDILAWAMHEYTEAERTGASFSWKGRTITPTLERAREYRRQQEAPWVLYRWRPYGFAWEHESAGESWSFVELVSGEELYREGQAMRHCVSGYASRCAAGFSAIVSVSVGTQQRLTIEIEPKTRRIVQVRGACNRSATPQETSIVARWLASLKRE